MDATTAFSPVTLNFSKLPASPPPDHNLLFRPAATASLANPHLYKQFAWAMDGPTVTVKKAPSLLEKHFQEQQQQKEKMQLEEAAQAQAKKSQQPTKREKAHVPDTPTTATFPSTNGSSSLSSAETKVHPQQQPTPPPTQQQPQQQQQQPQQPQPQPASQHRPISPPSETLNNNQPANPLLLGHPALLDPSVSADPQYLQMVSRMAAFYQQRCQAILNFQQQRCQTWATSHRQKCQELMQAAMLVVAWYIRDRIKRRRRRSKRTFRRGLREKAATRTRTTTGKGEAVRKWVLGIPNAAEEGDVGGQRCLDPDERAFDVEREVAPDQDGQLFAVADQMIKAQLAKIDVPLLGALNLDDSESESESEGENYYDYEDEEDDEEDYEDDEDEYYEDDLDDVVHDDDGCCNKEASACADVASKEAVQGTGGVGSLKRKRSESGSVVAEERFLNGRREM